MTATTNHTATFGILAFPSLVCCQSLLWNRRESFSSENSSFLSHTRNRMSQARRTSRSHDEDAASRDVNMEDVGEAPGVVDVGGDHHTPGTSGAGSDPSRLFSSLYTKEEMTPRKKRIARAIAVECRKHTVLRREHEELKQTIFTGAVCVTAKKGCKDMGVENQALFAHLQQNYNQRNQECHPLIKYEDYRKDLLRILRESGSYADIYAHYRNDKDSFENHIRCLHDKAIMECLKGGSFPRETIAKTMLRKDDPIHEKLELKYYDDLLNQPKTPKKNKQAGGNESTPLSSTTGASRSTPMSNNNTMRSSDAKKKVSRKTPNKGRSPPRQKHVSTPASKPRPSNKAATTSSKKHSSNANKKQEAIRKRGLDKAHSPGRKRFPTSAKKLHNSSTQSVAESSSVSGSGLNSRAPSFQPTKSSFVVASQTPVQEVRLLPTQEDPWFAAGSPFSTGSSSQHGGTTNGYCSPQQNFPAPRETDDQQRMPPPPASPCASFQPRQWSWSSPQQNASPFHRP